MDKKITLIIGDTTITMLSDKVVFSTIGHDENMFATFYIPNQFRNQAIKFYDLYLEQGHPTVILACRSNYDVAIRLNAHDGKMIDWHYTK